jgi:antitoxin (DNA-binding transcriptional repressor) of toxin-antitoxin stability system
MKIEHIGAFEAKTRLSELLEHVRLGRVYRITRRGRAIAELRPIVEEAPDRLTFGCDRGQVVVKDDFDAPIPGFEPYRR